ncbi:hypothetical protein INT48_008561 [Thamnidium elegans]|uniref:Uncharacterized protein n=1 Tax=Thamnidium elegans TaxID=101142 RepID=A0A8H7VWD7_9FUNG|nr:hypothetical protein INT48_008561 [Thamnidium elegans]
MFNSIRQYLSLSHNDGHNDGHNDEYVHQDNNWRQQKNHLVGNWLSDMSQQAEDREPHRHFWNRRKKKYYRNDIYNDELYQQQQQLQHHLQHPPQHQPQHLTHNQPQHLPQHHLQQQPMFERHRSHRSLSSLFRRDSKSNLMHQQLHQPMFGNEANGHEYRRQRHNSLPSSYNGKYKTGHQDNFTAGHQQQQQPFLAAGSMQQNGFSKHGGLDNEFQQPYYPQQQQHMQMLNNQDV